MIFCIFPATLAACMKALLAGQNEKRRSASEAYQIDKISQKRGANVLPNEICLIM